MRTDATQVPVGNRANTIHFAIIQNSNSILHTVLSLCKLCDILSMHHPQFYQCITPNMEFLLHADRLGHYFEWTSGCTYPHSRGFTMNPLGTSDERTPLTHSPFTMRRPETQALCQRTRTSRALIGRERSTVSGETRAGMCTCRGLVAGQTQGNQHNIKSTPCLH